MQGVFPYPVTDQKSFCETGTVPAGLVLQPSCSEPEVAVPVTILRPHLRVIYNQKKTRALSQRRGRSAAVR